ncbi:MAG: YitT family protein [Deltaproteobacteria bacterium]|nr:YitT family protein [Deltaproteobacteria bacterium]
MVQSSRSKRQIFVAVFSTCIGAFLAAFALEVFLLPNHIIDGGIVGISILSSELFGEQLLYPLVIILNIPFVYLAYKNIAKTFVIQMMVAVLFFAFFGTWISESGLTFFSPYRGELLEIVVIGGLVLGLGVGLIIRSGGCLDGTEILGLLINKRYGITVGNVVLAANVVIFAMAGLIFDDWHPPIQSLITFFIVVKIMDMVIVGLDEMKAVTIISQKPKEISSVLLHEMGIGLTVIYGRGGYSGEDREILYLIAERLQLSEIKTMVHNIDHEAVIAIENLHEVASSNMRRISSKV